MMSLNFQVGLLCLMCVLLGILVGLFAARATIRGAKKSGILRMENPAGAPVPPDLGYDPTNRINMGGKRETVKMCGVEWTLMSGRAGDVR